MNENFEIVKVTGFVKDKDIEKFPATLKSDLVRAQRALRRPADKVPCDWERPRLINCFKVGCDPEFVVQDEFGAPVHASDMGLGTGTAYGADGSGRPVELRAMASRFVVEVVASLLDTLRLFNAHVLSARRSNHWMTGGMVGRESIGGHIHFGRRQTKLRQEEVKVLDKVVDLLDEAGIFHSTRKQRVQRGQYGATSDHRQQDYGYEYRVPPSWLMSIGTAHLMMTLSKLAVVDRRLWNTISWTDKSTAIETIQKVLSGYRYIDEDANLAFRALDRTLVVPSMNFKSAWGCGSMTPTLPKNYMTPEIVKPCPQSIRDTIEYLTNAVVPPYRLPIDRIEIPEFNRELYKLPKGLIWAIDMKEVSTCIPSLDPSLVELITLQDGLRIAPDNRDCANNGILIEKGWFTVAESDKMRKFAQGIRQGATPIRVSLYRATGKPVGNRPWHQPGLLSMGQNVYSTRQQAVKLSSALVDSGAFPVFRVQNLPSADTIAHWMKLTQKSLKDYEQYRR